MGRPLTAAYKETKAQRPGTGVGGVYSIVRDRRTTQPRSRDCDVANHPGQDQDATEEAVCQGQAEPAYRPYALYDKISREEILSHAWRLVGANRGSPAVDAISFEAIESGIGVAAFLRELAVNLKDKPNRFGVS